jgi:DNA-binding PadR family transcriptional regulator
MCVKLVPPLKLRRQADGGRDGALYPILHKLEHEKVLVTASEHCNNRIRVYYSLTPKGHSVVAEKMNELNDFIESLQQIVQPKPGFNHA